MTSGPKRSKSNRQSSSPTSCHNQENNKEILTEDIENEDESSMKLYPLVQQRGQRKYGPPPDWTEEEPPRGCEVFVAKLPKDMLEDELIPVFETAGKIYEIRLMMETSEVNKSYAFVKYCYKEDSEEAVLKLHDYEIRPNFRISVKKSVDNNRLFVGNIPKCFGEYEVINQMKDISPGVVKVILYPSVNDRTKNRGYGFVEFENHQLAASARQKLRNSPVSWSGQEVKADWAEPELEVDAETMKRVRILYVRNLALSTTEQQLRDMFATTGESIERVKKLKDYAFIHFASREQAEKAKSKFHGYILDGCELDISWSKPVGNREEYQQRKAASKAMLSGTNIALPIASTTLGIHGESVIINQRVRNAAGAQGFTAPRPYPARTRQSEDSFTTLQPSPLLYANPYLTEMTVRSPLDLGLTAMTQPQTIYATERTIGSTEDFLNSSPTEIQYQMAAQHTQPIPRPQTWMTPQYILPQMTNTWAGPSFLSPITSAAAAASGFMPATQYVIPSTSYAAGPYACHQYFPGQLIPQLTNITGSNMSIDRS